MDVMYWLSEMFGYLPEMIQGCIDVISFAMSVSVRDCLFTFASLTVGVSPELAAIIQLLTASLTNPIFDMPLFVVMFGAGFAMYALFSIVKWILELFT